MTVVATNGHCALWSNRYLLDSMENRSGALRGWALLVMHAMQRTPDRSRLNRRNYILQSSVPRFSDDNLIYCRQSRLLTMVESASRASSIESAATRSGERPVVEIGTVWSCSLCMRERQAAA